MTTSWTLTPIFLSVNVGEVVLCEIVKKDLSVLGVGGGLGSSRWSTEYGELS